MEFLQLRPCDIVCIKSMSPLGWLIRQCSRTIGEARSEINHVGMISVGGDIKEVPLIEALTTVKEHPMWARYSKRKSKVAIFRPLNLSDEDRETIFLTARRYVGNRYGYADLALHLADWALLGAYVFRRFAGGGDYPICSWVVASSFAVAGYSFGVPIDQAQPDDIWDFCIDTLGTYYHLVRPLDYLVD